MDLSFAEKTLRDMCEKEAKALKSLGPNVAAKLHRRLSDLRSAETFGDVVAGRPTLKDDHVELSLGDGHVLFVQPEFPGVQWRNSTRAKIVRVSQV